MLLFCFSNQTATTDIYTLSLHDALPISRRLDVAREEEVRHLLPGTGRAMGHHAPHRADLEQVASDRKSTRLNSSHRCISYAVFCLKKKKTVPSMHITKAAATPEDSELSS